MDSKEQDKNINSSENSHIEVDSAAGTVTTTQSRNWIWGLVIIALLIVLGIFGYVGSQALFSVVFWILLILLLVIACIAYIIVFLAIRGHKKTALITFIVAVTLFFLSIPTLGYILVFAGFYDVASQIQDETLNEDYDGELAYEYMNEQYRSFSLEEIQQMKKEKLDIDSFIAKYGKATKASVYDSFISLDYGLRYR